MTATRISQCLLQTYLHKWWSSASAAEVTCVALRHDAAVATPDTWSKFAWTARPAVPSVLMHSQQLWSTLRRMWSCQTCLFMINPRRWYRRLAWANSTVTSQGRRLPGTNVRWQSWPPCSSDYCNALPSDDDWSQISRHVSLWLSQPTARCSIPATIHHGLRYLMRFSRSVFSLLSALYTFLIS